MTFHKRQTSDERTTWCRAARAPRLAAGLAGLLAAAALVAGCGGSSGGASASTKASDNPYAGTLTYWYWAESDAPGANKWMKSMIAKYEQLHPKIHINLVPQGTDTLIGAFNAAAQTKSGPDIATQWATLPTLTPAWTGESVPISAYVPKTEWSHWVDTQENMSGGKLWAMPQYLLGVPMVWNKQLFRKAGLDPNKPPATYQDLLTDCSKLKAKGITPIGEGNKDGYTGNWFFAIFGKDGLSSLKQLEEAILGKANFASPQFSRFYSQVSTLIKNGCFNNDISSLDLNQGWQLFPQKKAAISWTTDGNALAWAKTLGEKNIGVAPPPVFGNGAMSSLYDATQSSDEFITSWSKHKRAAAAFLTWLHTPANLVAWYSATHVFPADNRFSPSHIKDPLARKLFKYDVRKSAWLENYLPPQVDQNGDLPAGQMITSGSGSPSKAVGLWKQVLQQWKVEHPDQYQQYQKWASGS